jgi:hypothetical protein
MRTRAWWRNIRTILAVVGLTVTSAGCQLLETCPSCTERHDLRCRKKQPFTPPKTPPPGPGVPVPEIRDVVLAPDGGCRVS